jgi:hypothetical protein
MLVVAVVVVSKTDYNLPHLGLVQRLVADLAVVVTELLIDLHNLTPALIEELLALQILVVAVAVVAGMEKLVILLDLTLFQEGQVSS